MTDVDPKLAQKFAQYVGTEFRRTDDIAIQQMTSIAKGFGYTSLDIAFKRGRFMDANTPSDQKRVNVLLTTEDNRRWFISDKFFLG